MGTEDPPEPAGMAQADDDDGLRPAASNGERTPPTPPLSAPLLRREPYETDERLAGPGSSFAKVGAYGCARYSCEAAAARASAAPAGSG
jgi:hypothetical protein